MTVLDLFRTLSYQKSIDLGKIEKGKTKTGAHILIADVPMSPQMVIQPPWYNIVLTVETCLCLVLAWPNGS